MTLEQAQTLVGREFVHFKGNRYRLVAIAKHSETLEPIVVYRALYGEGGIWVRPFSMFFEDVNRDGYSGPRFRLAEDGANGASAGNVEAADASDLERTWPTERNYSDSFPEALVSGKTDRIPDEYDWFKPLLGDWDCDYYDEYEGKKRHVKGEWLFRRILDGSGVQDIFIFPSRETMKSNPQPDGEYGTSLRMFNRGMGCYDVVYTCDHVMKRLCFTKEGDCLQGRVLDEETSYWMFSDITGDSFRWEYMKIKPDGSKELVCKIVGKRTQ